MNFWSTNVITLWIQTLLKDIWSNHFNRQYPSNGHYHEMGLLNLCLGWATFHRKACDQGLPLLPMQVPANAHPGRQFTSATYLVPTNHSADMKEVSNSWGQTSPCSECCGHVGSKQADGRSHLPFLFLSSQREREGFVPTSNNKSKEKSDVRYITILCHLDFEQKK